MAGSLVQEKGTDTAGGGTTLAVTLTNSVVAGNTIHIIWSYDTALGTSESGSDNKGNSYTTIGGLTDGGHNQRIGHSSAVASTGGSSFQCILNTPGSNTSRCVDGREISGVTGVVNQHKENSQVAPGTGANAVLTGTASTTQTCFISALAARDDIGGVGSSPLTSGTGYTQGDNTLWLNQVGGATSEHQAGVAAGSVQATWTTSINGDFLSCYAAFVEGSTAPVGFPLTRNVEFPGKGPHMTMAFNQGRPAVNFVPPSPVNQATSIPKFINPGRHPGPVVFPEFQQGVRAPTPPIDPATSIPKFINPGRHPGPRRFPDFRQGVAPPQITVTGAFASQLDDVAVAFNGVVTNNGQFASQLDDVAMAFQGQILSGVAGSFASTLDDVVFAGTGVVTNQGSFASQLQDVTMTFNGSVINQGAFASQLGDVVMAFNGIVSDPGSFASQLDNVTMAFNGQVIQNVTGAFASQLGDVTMSFQGNVDTPAGASRQRPQVGFGT